MLKVVNPAFVNFCYLTYTQMLSLIFAAGAVMLHTKLHRILLQKLTYQVRARLVILLLV
jgi:hypothetical protein